MTKDSWLTLVEADAQASNDVRNVAKAIAECSPDDGIDIGIGGGDVFADEFLFQIADDVSSLPAVSRAVRWLADRGHLEITAWTAAGGGSFLICTLVAPSR